MPDQNQDVAAALSKAADEGKAVLAAGQSGQKATRGRIVMYQVKEGDAPEILHNGNNPGSLLPAVVVNDFNGGIALNLKVFCDGPADAYKTSVQQGTQAGQWQWPSRS